MLDDMEWALLAFERSWANQDGPKDRMIETTLGLTSEEYYTRLLELIFDNRAHDHDPLTVRRLRRLVEAGPPAEAAG